MSRIFRLADSPTLATLEDLADAQFTRGAHTARPYSHGRVMWTINTPDERPNLRACAYAAYAEIPPGDGKTPPTGAVWITGGTPEAPASLTDDQGARTALEGMGAELMLQSLTEALI